MSDDFWLMPEGPIWEIVPYTDQRYIHLLEVESGAIWWDPTWRKFRKTGTARGSFGVRPSIEFVHRFGLAYPTQKMSPAGWFQCGLTTDGQILLTRWKQSKRKETDSGKGENPDLGSDI